MGIICRNRCYISCGSYSLVYSMKKTKLILIILIWISGLFDLITFFLGNHTFEANPLYLLSKSYILLLGFKFIVLAGVTYLIMFYKPKKRYIWSFMLMFISVYCILAQCIGGYSNLQVQHEINTNPPGEVVPMEEQKAMLSYSLIFGVIILYLPMLMSFLSFWVFERIYL